MKRPLEGGGGGVFRSAVRPLAGEKRDTSGTLGAAGDRVSIVEHVRGGKGGGGPESGTTATEREDLVFFFDPRGFKGKTRLFTCSPRV